MHLQRRQRWGNVLSLVNTAHNQYLDYVFSLVLRWIKVDSNPSRGGTRYSTAGRRGSVSSTASKVGE